MGRDLVKVKAMSASCYRHSCWTVQKLEDQSLLIQNLEW